jgi:hypothetical protein
VQMPGGMGNARIDWCILKVSTICLLAWNHHINKEAGILSCSLVECRYLSPSHKLFGVNNTNYLFKLLG